MKGNVVEIDKRSRIIGISMVMIGALGFAFKGIFIKKAYAFGVDSASLLAFRMVFAMPFYMLVLFWDQKIKKNKLPRFRPQTWLAVFFLSFLGYFLASIINFEGMRFVDASLERIILFVYPTFVLAINYFYNKKPIIPIQLIAIAITYLGIWIAYKGNVQVTNSPQLGWGVTLVLLSGVVYSVYLVGCEGIMKKINAIQFTCVSMIFAVIPVSGYAIAVNGFDFFNFAPEAYYYSVLMALFSTVIPTFMYMGGIQRVGATNMSIIASIGPIFTIFLASHFLEEIVAPLQIVGTCFVLLGIYLISQNKHK